MLKIIREFLGWLVRASGIFFVLYRKQRRKTAIILVYHDPSPETFERHAAYLSRRFTFVSLDLVINALEKKQWSDLPSRACVVTFDDGHAGNYKLLPFFKKYSMMPTIFLCSAIVNTNRRFWWKSGIGSAEPFKHVSNAEMLARLKRQTGFGPEKEYADRQALSAEEIAALSPYVEFGSHTRFHPILTNCDDIECMKEIADSKKEIERLTGKETRHFAYPNGNYSHREIAMVKKAGYASARTICFGYVSAGSDLYALRAVEIDDMASVNVLCAEFVGLNAVLKKLLKKVWNYSAH
jgi:peptidoglycan/xylan/chitin deacetylase (PgdA/CDA1 family)